MWYIDDDERRGIHLATPMRPKGSGACVDVLTRRTRGEFLPTTNPSKMET